MSDEEGLKELLRKAGYSEKAIDHYIKKRNVGVIEGAEAAESHTGLCGDSMRVYLKIEKGLIIRCQVSSRWMRWSICIRLCPHRNG
jgi:nitrogen fixation NifU-like protein